MNVHWDTAVIQKVVDDYLAKHPAEIVCPTSFPVRHDDMGRQGRRGRHGMKWQTWMKMFTESARVLASTAREVDSHGWDGTPVLT